MKKILAWLLGIVAVVVLYILIMGVIPFMPTKVPDHYAQEPCPTDNTWSCQRGVGEKTIYTPLSKWMTLKKMHQMSDPWQSKLKADY